MPRFVEDDDGFMAWANDHPNGFVLNVERNPKAGYLILHTATCAQIIDRRTAPGRRTYDYIKVCAEAKADLERLGQS